MFNPEYMEVQWGFCSACTACAACGVCGSCLACLIDGPIPDFEGAGVGAVGSVGIVVGVASW